MTYLPTWRTLGLAGAALCAVAWTGSASAAQWANPQLLTTPGAVKKNINKPNWVVVDCRSLKDYVKGHIPGAISLGNNCHKALRDATSRVFRDISKYEKFLCKVGIGNNTNVVLYYGTSARSIPQATVAFWVLEYLGHDKVSVLNGGIGAWRKAGNRLDAKPTRKAPTTFKANVKKSRYGSTDEIVQVATGKASSQLIDSRTKKEHIGKDMRAIRGGKVPNTTINVSHVDTLAQAKNAKTGKMGATPYFSADVVAAKFASLDKNKRTVAYCQTGTRSTMTYLQLRLLGFKDPANWDDSWRVYGSTLSLPVANEQWYNFSGLNNKLKKLAKKVKALEAKAKK